MEKGVIPPCHRNPTFTNPVEGTPEYEAAVELCAGCPYRKECARDALAAGDSIDGHVTRPAMGVLQAGVLCNGNPRTIMALARIAGIPEDDWPTISDTTPRNAPPPYCRNCHAVMVGWTRGAIPPGRVMHHGRGLCTNCRAVYRAELRRDTDDGTVTHYDGGRTRTQRPRPEELEPGDDGQLELFTA